MAFEVEIPRGSCGVDGGILRDQVKTIDWRAREVKSSREDVVPQNVMDAASGKQISVLWR
jgi:mRNA-degrading endonuclease toxin of MazEF toxin-antitoxin module